MYNPICSRFVPARSQKILLCEEKNICRRTPPNLHEHISALCGLRIFFPQLEELFLYSSQRENIIYKSDTKFGISRNIFLLTVAKAYFCPRLEKGFPFSWEKIIRGKLTLPNSAEHIWQSWFSVNIFLLCGQRIFVFGGKNISIVGNKYFHC